MTLDLWPHQEKMTDFCRDRNSVIGDLAMGAGKTPSTVYVLSDVWDCRLVLILAPKAVVASHTPWGREFEQGRFTDKKWEVVRLFKGSVPARAKKLKAAGKLWKDSGGEYNLAIVLNYEATLSKPMYELLKSVPWCCVVLDEIHRTKGYRGKMSRKVSKICNAAKRRLGLTGTLLPHSPSDLWAQMRAIDPKVFGTSFVKFRNRYCVLGGFQGRAIVAFQNTDEMMELCRDHIIRLTEDDMDLGLIDPVDEDVVLDMCPKATRIYSQLDEEMIAQVNDGLITVSNALVKMIRLMQLTGGTAVTDDVDDLGEVTHNAVRVDSTKVDYIADMVQDTDDQIVVFCLFHADIDAIRRAVDDAGKSALELSGRENGLDRWKAGEAQVLVVQINAGAEGIDLTDAHLCVFYSTGHSLGKYLQARKRLDRPGQERRVIFKHLLIDGSIDLKVRKALERREEVVTSVLDQLREDVECSA